MKKTIVNLSAEKDGSNLFLKIKLDPKLELFFSNLSKSDTGETQTQTSAKWLKPDETGLVFYLPTEKNKTILEKLKQNYSFNSTIDNFGSGLFSENSIGINIAILRIVGTSASPVSFNVSDLVNYDELKTYIEKLGEITKEIYKNYIIKQKITARITFEF